MMTKIKVKNKPKIAVIVGPTASGKSSLGIFLAQKFKGEIISADSRQVYKGMDIGAGKVTKKEQWMAKHHLLDVVDPKKVFTVSDFKKLGKKAIDEILERKRLPIIVGGTGFYIDALVRNINVPEIPPNKKLRAQFDKLTVEQLFEKLNKLDPERAKSIDKNNKRRIIRALEIIEAIGKVPSLNTNYSLFTTNYDILWLGLNPKNLEKRIRERLDSRFKQGMIKEVKNLIKKGVSKKRLEDFGLEYRWAGRYLNKKIPYKDMKNELLREIIKYSKRQMTWFKRNKEIHWVKNPREAEKFTRKFLSSHL